MEEKNHSFSKIRRKRLETQGFTGLTDKELNEFQYGMRFAYLLCISIVLIGLILKNTDILLFALIISFFGSFLPRHPFDYLYNFVAQTFLGKPKIPKRGPQGRFACGIATVWLGVTIYLFSIGLDLWGYILGYALVVVAGLVAFLDICIPSIIYNFFFLRKK